MANLDLIAVVGLGYVGLPLAVEFGKRQKVLGFDINAQRISQLQGGNDVTNEVTAVELTKATHLSFTMNSEDLSQANVYIVTVPSPIDDHNQPDLRPLRDASETIGRVLKPGDVVVYESTVFPGCTEEECVPVLERASGLIYNQDFFAGYSPERINPGDKVHTVANITKITSGSTPEVAERVDELYASIVTAGTHKVSSIRVAEAAKVIENTQRDLNIALINELAMIFEKMDIDTEEVLLAAGTKWNFLPFRPGLVGGHCIGVDPYYLTHRAQALGYHPEMILSGRRVNDGMASFVVNQMVKKMIFAGLNIIKTKVLVMGLTFKENCPDIRNSKVFDVISALESYGITVEVYDPLVNSADLPDNTGLSLLPQPAAGRYDGICIAVAHDEFTAFGPDKVRSLLNSPDGVVLDLKGIFGKQQGFARI